jgi:hypothetical protein
LLRAGRRLKELPISTYYRDEIRSVKGVKYAYNVLRSSLLSRAQDYSILYERKFGQPARGKQYLLSPRVPL